MNDLDESTAYALQNNFVPRKRLYVDSLGPVWLIVPSLINDLPVRTYASRDRARRVCARYNRRFGHIDNPAWSRPFEGGAVLNSDVRSAIDHGAIKHVSRIEPAHIRNRVAR